MLIMIAVPVVVGNSDDVVVSSIPGLPIRQYLAQQEVTDRMDPRTKSSMFFTASVPRARTVASSPNQAQNSSSDLFSSAFVLQQ